jgi:hypothetical protein
MNGGGENLALEKLGSFLANWPEAMNARQHDTPNFKT